MIDLRGNTVRFIESFELIQPTDLCRELYESHPEHGGWNTTWKSKDWRGTDWHPVKTDLRGWVGRTYQEYMNHCKLDNHPHHEIIRILI